MAMGQRRTEVEEGGEEDGKKRREKKKRAGGVEDLGNFRWTGLEGEAEALD